MEDENEGIRIQIDPADERLHESPDIWENMTGKERKSRAQEALIGFVEDHLREDGGYNDDLRDLAEQIVNSVSEEEHRTIRRAVLERRQDDGSDRMYTEDIAEALCEYYWSEKSDI